MSSGVRLMAFWAKQAQNGETYHEGRLGGATVRLFLNNYRKTEKDPDVIMYISQTPFDKSKAKAPVQAAPQKSRITPRPQPQQMQARNPEPPKPAYKDHTADSKPWDDGSPFPGEDDMPF